MTELVTGIDLVREQIRVAAGEKLGYGQQDVRFTGHADRVPDHRRGPEDADAARRARSPPTIAPGGPGVRVDSALYAGYRCRRYYDSLIAKLIVHDVDRDSCLRRRRAGARRDA